ncbi:MAG: helix-turn-helix transcriptional regulator [Pirellulales bacterium]|nr:helix-turn-helix transcriptional regulator [Pirellulales bacterium]
MRRLADITGLQQRTVRMHLRNLEVAGLIKIESRTKGKLQLSNLYRIVAPPESPRNETPLPPERNDGRVGAFGAGTPLNETTPEVDTLEQDSLNKTHEQELYAANAANNLLDQEVEFIDTWNKTEGVKRCRGKKLTDTRRRVFRTRLKKKEWFANYQLALKKFPLKCTTADPNGWRPDMDWILKPDSVTKILEGKYDWTPSSGNGKQKSTIGPGQRHPAGANFIEGRF